MPHLVVEDREGNRQVVPLGAREIVIGRQETCDVVLSRADVSRRHATVGPAPGGGGGWILRDLKSTHGTRINGGPATEHVLADGDLLHISEFSIRFSTAPAGAATSPPPPVAVGAAPDARITEAEATSPHEQAKREPELVGAVPVEDTNLIRRTIAASRLDLEQISGERPALSAALLQAAPVAIAPTPVEDPTMALLRISDGIHKCTEVDDVCRVALDMALKIFRADRGVIALDDGNGGYRPRAQMTRAGSQGALVISKTFVERVLAEKQALVAVDASSDAGLSTAVSVAAVGIRSVVGVPLFEGTRVLGYVYLDRLGQVGSFGQHDLELLCVVTYHAAAEIARLQHAESVRQEREQRRNLSRFLSADVIRHLGESAAGAMSTRPQKVTILFSDIQGFTTLSESLPSDDLKRFLDVYFDRMTEILIDRHGGTLDKYIGDGIMGLFGAPYSRGEALDAKSAVAAAVDMCGASRAIGDELLPGRRFAIRVGVNTGMVLAGMLGSQRRLEYSVLGDAVNVASRLESSAQPGRIQIGEATYELVKDAFACEYSGERAVRNRVQPVKTWWVNGPLG